MSDTRQISIARVAIVTLALMIVGAIVGAATSAIALIVVSLIQGSRSFQGVMFGLGFATFVGAVIGTVMAPVIAWVLLRRVPLWRAITQTALGTLIGAIAMSFFPPGPIVGAIAGFTLAAIRLRIVTRPATPALPDTDTGGELP